METIETIIQWHRETFPDATFEGQQQKWEDEFQEFCDSGIKDISELADMFIVACGIARFDSIGALGFFVSISRFVGTKYDELRNAVQEKMKINRARKWDFAGGKYQHIAGKGSSPAADMGSGIGGQSNK